MTQNLYPQNIQAILFKSNVFKKVKIVMQIPFKLILTKCHSNHFRKSTFLGLKEELCTHYRQDQYLKKHFEFIQPLSAAVVSMRISALPANSIKTLLANSPPLS